ncbi:MAG: VCBS repeat-containing protein [Planctomycetota bacterium]|nr:MAG: VCBS repeat-containing protein [Planctomycetota bacterium]
MSGSTAVRRGVCRTLVAASLSGWLVGSLAAAEFPTFVARTLDPQIGKVCYAVTVADVDADGRNDIVAVTENRVLWYQAPGWKKRVIIEDQTPRDNVCIAPHDIDGDGLIDFALGAGWTKIGTIHWLRRRSSLDEKWQVFSIGREPWLHRMRWADVLGKGRPQLVISPLNATQGKGVRLMAFEVPARPESDRWPATILDHSLNRMHNHWHVDLDGDGTIDTLTASREGVHWITRRDGAFVKVRLAAGEVADDPNQSGAGEVKTGRSGDGLYIVTVEPMHGHTLSVYTPQGALDRPWKRHVIDHGFRRGHAIWTADFDADGDDDIAFGHSDTPEVPGVNVYECVDAHRGKWRKHVIDAGGIATEDLVATDLTGDGVPDIVAGGRATHNLKLYVAERRAGR